MEEGFDIKIVVKYDEQHAPTVNSMVKLMGTKLEGIDIQPELSAFRKALFLKWKAIERERNA